MAEDMAPPTRFGIEENSFAIVLAAPPYPCKPISIPRNSEAPFAENIDEIG